MRMMPNSVGVLLIEDDPAVLLGTQQTLQLAGFEVEPFADAESAIPSIVPVCPRSSSATLSCLDWTAWACL